MLSSEIIPLTSVSTDREIFGDDFESIFLRLLWPVKLCDVDSNPPLTIEVLGRIASKLKSEKPNYSNDIKKLVFDSKAKSDIQIGKSFNITSLLSFNGNSNYLFRNNGSRVVLDEHTFARKHVMVCCFQVPMFRLFNDRPPYFHSLGNESLTFQSLATICHDKYASGDDDFEMVVVAKMNELTDYERFFDHFLSAFPPSCLLVPFDDPMRRDYICYYLDLHLSSTCLIVDHSGIVLLNEYPSFAGDYGADAFPFTPQSLHEIQVKEEPFGETPSTSCLEQLLGCTSYDVLDRINLKGVREVVSISKLKEKVVGLFFVADLGCFYERSFAFTLRQVYEQCKARHLDFEVVVVYLPFSDCLDPDSFVIKADRLMQENKISWWRMPFNNSKCRRLWRISCCGSDQLIIIGPHDEYVDFHAKEIMWNYGVDAYPFTRDGLVQSQSRLLRELTLESLLAYGSRDYVLRGNASIPVAELQPKSILLYLACIQTADELDLYQELLAWYHQIKKKDPDFEVVFVRRTQMVYDYFNQEYTTDFSEENVFVESRPSSMPWLICPFNPEHSTYLEKKLFSNCSAYDTIIAFGSDGHVCSVDAQELLRVAGPHGFPLEDRLCKEVLFRLDSIHQHLYDGFQLKN